VISSAAAVSAVLADPDCRVRPAAEPVPAGLVGTAAGEVFGDLVRMTDGQFHDRVKAVIVDALGQLSTDQVSALAGRRARACLASLPTESVLDELMFAVPAQVVAGLCGLEQGSDEQAARLIGQFVQCLPASASPAQQADAARAAGQLQQLMGPLLRADTPGLLGELVRAAARADWPKQAPLLANGIGFLSQTYDATAGLIGNSLLALVREGVPAAGQLAGFVREVARHDSPVHNTRRFSAGPMVVSDCSIEQGESLLLLLAAANRDPAVNLDPAEFRPGRPAPALFTFGAAGHGCPGESLAVGIATAVLDTILDAGWQPAEARSLSVAYRPSGNIRVPLLTGSAVAFSNLGDSG
jgi:cytochrome P450